jgi:hypothetical protein
MDWLVLKVGNSHGGIMMTVEFNKCESPVCLHPDFDNIAVTLEQGDQVGLTDIGDQIANIDRRVVFGGLSGDGFVREGRCGRV